MRKIWHIIDKRLKASTLIELLLTMIISGIIFLLVFEGVEIIKKINFSVNNRLTDNERMLYSHQFIEYLMENADSVIQQDNNLLFFREGFASDSLSIEPSSFILKSKGSKDTLFQNYIDYRILFVLETQTQVDSLFIVSFINTKDSIHLEYGLSLNRYAYLNSYENNEDYK